MNVSTSRSPRVQRLERQQNVLFELGRRWRWYEADIDKAVSAIVETATAALAVDRSSVWFFNDDHSMITCSDLFEATPSRHSRNTVLHAKDFPAYFEALHGEEIIAAHDAYKDPRTQAFAEPYLEPLGIGAMLDAPVRFGGRAVGVLCNEHVGGARHFSTDEQNTASYLANMVSLAYEFQRRAESEQRTARALSLLRAVFEASGAGILAVDTERRITEYNQRLIDIWGIDEQVLQISDTNERIALISAKTRNPEEVAARVKAVYLDLECDSLDVFDLKDGRSVECVSSPHRLDGRVIGRVWSFRDVTYQRNIENELRELSIRDGLTGLFNRRRGEERLIEEIQRARRSKLPLAIALIDIDHFKDVNDVHGHQVGDEVLKALATDFNRRMRVTDVPCRWGGEEFLLILPDTDLKGAIALIDELRRYIQRERRDLPSFTISAGVAELGADEQHYQYHQIVAEADARLYEAKQSGRNKVV